MDCYACERPARPSTAVVIENLYDGETLVMHRGCILKIVAQCPEELAAQFHHHIAPLFYGGETGAREREASDGKSIANMVRVGLGEAMAAEPTVPQHPLGWVPDDKA